MTQLRTLIMYTNDIELYYHAVGHRRQRGIGCCRSGDFQTEAKEDNRTREDKHEQDRFEDQGSEKEAQGDMSCTYTRVCACYVCEHC